ncbi:adenosylcobinamide-phosphate synthase CbiB [Deinococcus cellulosilyticus]|uniref:Cobalamin biosynthesis protein CobD n=1 Tax=Deinococcus cellulosilyticus (strain DSM 18568 / NBRC 106333 / KACC 11606 / 5516J-15) TaxID=1223518 RepID=A0A511N9K6_DEIC1|nr:adenosylcobinamide-phosphate synthase CbiB [Deinococcus cellulosilyticus]GEM49514.1 cobalamin biosynthesis protein CobD [Deinococcus cellulosilyticus NBRC 106333 = KACC 11606]
MALLSGLSVLLAFLLDHLGEPPMKFHPVVWMGNYLRAARRLLFKDFFAGLLGWGVGAVLVLGLAAGVQLAIHQMSPGWQILLTAVCLKPLMAWSALRKAGESVLLAPTLQEARRELSWHLVSRDTSELSESEVMGAAMESVAENLSDSLVAPLFWFLIGGLPMVAFYRYCNTADAMWGYRTPELEHFGKVAARVDDLLNLIPARLTGLLICAVHQSKQAWNTMNRDALKTPSPNSGYPMAALAGLIGVRLSKRDTYDLGAGFRDPEKSDLALTLKALHRVAWISVVFLSGVSCFL